MIVEDLEDWHLLNIALQPHQTLLAASVADPVYRHLLTSHEGYAGVVDGHVVCAAGAISQGPGRALVWALLAGELPMIPVHRAVHRWLGQCQIRRLETWVRVGHAEGVRWAEMLGFELEGRMKAFLPDGSDAWLFARVK